MTSRAPSRSRYLLLVALGVELLDELVDGARSGAWAAIRRDLQLSYVQIGLLLSIPGILGNCIEPFVFLLGDVWRRRTLIIGGAIGFGLALFLVSSSFSMAALLVAFCVYYPCSGSFVSLTQANLMDAQPGRREHNMARWAVAGSCGMVVGPLLVAMALTIGAGWRSVFLALGVTAIVFGMLSFRVAPTGTTDKLSVRSVFYGFREALRACRSGRVARWLVLLEMANLMLDVLLGFLTLYFVDVAKLSIAHAALAVSVWTVVGFVGDLALVPLLEKVSGLRYLRWSAWIELVLFVAFLLVPAIATKLVLLALLGFFNSGWYAILKAQLYASMPGKSGTSLAIGNIAGVIGSVIPIILGIVAKMAGIGPAMWLLAIGPIALIIALPRQAATKPDAGAI